MELDISECELLGDIRTVLLENPLLKIHSNFIFTYQKQKLKEFVPLSQQIETLTKNVDLYLEFSSFNERTANQHVIASAQFFENPENFLYDNFLEFNIFMGKTEYIQNAFEEQDLETNTIEIEAFQSSDLQVLNKISYFGHDKHKSNLFFQELTYSKFNPPQGQSKMQGDLLYLDFLSNENNWYCLTINKNGCFSNSSENNIFSSKPISQIFLSLFDLLENLSQSFSSTLKNYYDLSDSQIYKKFCEKFKLTKGKRNQFPIWLQENQQPDKRVIYLKNLVEILRTEFFGNNFVQYRDFNEEFQNCKTLSTKDTLQQIHKIKILRKSQNDFLYAAKEFSKAVVEENLIPLNPSEQKMENCYVFNNLFATYAQDSLDWELPKTEVAPSTFSTINNDLRNLKILYELEIQDVNTINTCTIDYLGHRVIIQNVIQGILHFDQKTWNCYGSIDDGKTMNWNEDFHLIMKNICDKFNITLENEFLDELGKKYVFHGSPEVKGIKAGDGRKYIMDLMRLSPRDANYPDPKKHECCVLRPELVRSYLFYQNFQEILQKQSKEKNEKYNNKSEETENQQQNEKTKENEEKKDQDQEMIKSLEEQIDENENSLKLQQELQKQEELVQNLMNEEKISQKRFNTSLFTQIESVGEKNIEEKKELENVAKFLKEQAISVYLNNITQNPMLMPMDKESLIDSLHKNGINLRYLGYIYSIVTKSKNVYFKELIERVVFVKSFMKYLRQITFEVNQNTFLQIFIQKLNQFLGNDVAREIIENKINSNFQQTETTKTEKLRKTNENKNKKKKKNKHKKNQKSIIDIQIEIQNKNLLEKSSDFLEVLKNYANMRYDFDVKNINSFNDLTFLKNNKDKISFMREIAKHLGIQFAPKIYNFNILKESQDLPLKTKDISGFYPIAKSPQYFIELLKFNYKAIEQEIINKNLDGALLMLKASQNMIVSTYGIYNQEFIFNCSKIANILFLKKKVDQAIKMQIFIIKINELIYGIDHYNTAFAILELSNYYFEQKSVEKCVMLHQQALFIFDLMSSTHNPNSIFCLHELQILFEEQKNNNKQMILMEELLNRNVDIFGQTDERLLYYLMKLAALKAEQKDFENASLLQARHYMILSRVIKNTHNLSQQYKATLQVKLEESKKN